MSDFIGSFWGKCKKGRLKEINKRQFLILAIIFMLGIRLFFSVFLGDSNVWAKNEETYYKNRIVEAQPMHQIIVEAWHCHDSKGARGIAKESFKYPKDTLETRQCLVSTGKGIFKKPEPKYQDLLEGYPIENMLPDIEKLDEKTADFLIAIAKKESNWGKRAPSKDGQDCYNYWGYKGRGEAQVLGYSCFSSREEAIEKIGARIDNLIENGIDTPERMLVWKCGSSCSGHNPQDVRKWVADVESVLKSIRS